MTAVGAFEYPKKNSRNGNKEEVYFYFTFYGDQICKRKRVELLNMGVQLLLIYMSLNNNIGNEDSQVNACKYAWLWEGSLPTAMYH